MNKSIPIFNRLVVERDLRKKYNLHKQKIHDIQLQQTMYQKPLKVTKAQVNRKAIMMEEQKRIEIEKANIMLLSKLSKIMNKTFRAVSPITVTERLPQASAQGVRQSRSLNREYRIKKLTQISEENQAFFQRLVQQKGKYGEEKDHIKKYEYFMSNFNRFKPIGWEDERRSRSYQLNQSQKPYNSSGQVDSLTPQIRDDSSPPPKTAPSSIQSIQRRHFVGNKFYQIEIGKTTQDNRMLFEIKATEEASKKVYKITMDSAQANRMFSVFNFDLDTLVSRIRFLKNTMVLCPPEVEPYAPEEPEQSTDLNSSGIVVNRSKDLFKVYRQKNERNYIELLKVRNKKLQTSSDEKRKTSFSRDMYRTTRFNKRDYSLNDHPSPQNPYMKVSEVLHDTEKTTNHNQSNDYFSQRDSQDQDYINNMIQDQIESNQSLEIKESTNIQIEQDDAREDLYDDNFEQDQDQDCQQI